MNVAELLSSLTIRSPSIDDIRSPSSKDVFANDVSGALAGLAPGPYAALLAKFVDDSRYRWRLLQEVNKQIGNVKSCVVAVNLYIYPFNICATCKGTGVGLGPLYFIKACMLCEGVGRVELRENSLAKMIKVSKLEWREKHAKDYKQATNLLNSWEITGLYHLRDFLWD